MNKWSLTLLAGLAAFALQAAPAILRVDVNGVLKEGKVEIAPVDGEGMMKGVRANWIKEENRSGYLCFAMTKPLSAEWSEQTFSFKAEADGKVDVSVGGQWSEKAENRGWLLLGPVKLNDTLLANSDYAKTTTYKEKVMPNGYWLNAKAELLADQGPEGKGAIKVNHDNRMSRSVSVKAGETYKFTFMVKAAE